MARSGEDPLAKLLTRWDYERSPPQVVALGSAALERLLDGRGGLWRLGTDPRDYQDAVQEAVAAFAKRDLDGVLAEMRKRGWSDRDVLWAGVGRVADPRVVSMLLADYSSKDAFVRLRTVGLLGAQHDPRATEALIHALSDRSSQVRWVAITSLGEAGDSSAITPLQDFAKRARERWVAEYARLVIAQIRKARRSR